ncbi:MAG: hypothetical protein WBM37_06680 [Nitrososphaeraceae archaeon]
MPDGSDIEPSVSYSPDPNSSFYGKKVEPKGAFAELQKKGLKQTYTGI